MEPAGSIVGFIWNTQSRLRGHPGLCIDEAVLSISDIVSPLLIEVSIIGGSVYCIRIK